MLQRTLNARLDPSPGPHRSTATSAPGPGRRSFGFRGRGSCRAPARPTPTTLEALGPPPPDEPPVASACGRQRRARHPEAGPPTRRRRPSRHHRRRLGGDRWQDRRLDPRGNEEKAATRDPASTTKMMTALIVARLIQERPPGPRRGRSPSPSGPTQTPGSTSGVRAGEHVVDPRAALRPAPPLGERRGRGVRRALTGLGTSPPKGDSLRPNTTRPGPTSSTR